MNPSEEPAPDAAAEQARIDALVDQTLDIKEPVGPPPKPGEKPLAPKAEEPEAPVEIEEPETPEEPEEEEPEAPAEPQGPSDQELFIEVEDALGEKFKITKIEDLPSDFTPKNNRQILEIMKATDKLEQDIAKRDADNAIKEQEAVIEAQREAISKGWDSEIQELLKEGLLNKPKVAADNPKYAEDPAVKQTDVVFKYIKDENDRRKAAGNPNLLTSFKDAFRLQAYDAMLKEQDEAKKGQSSVAKAKAGLIGGNSAPAKEEQVYVAGSARSIWDI